MHIELDAGLGSIACSRRWVVERAREHGLPSESMRIVELLTSELVTNAVKYGPARGTIRVTTDWSSREVRVAVGDDGRSMPVIRSTSPSDVGGRGIQLVDMLATAWGVEEQPDEGKVVWFRLRV